MIINIISKMDIVKDILDNIINYALFFYDDETVEQEQLDKSKPITSLFI